MKTLKLNHYAIPNPIILIPVKQYLAKLSQFRAVFRLISISVMALLTLSFMNSMAMGFIAQLMDVAG
jgi:hypothetical protein